METNYRPHFTLSWCRGKISSQQTSSPSNLHRFGKSLRHGQQKRSPFKTLKTWYKWQYVQFCSSISLKSHISGSNRVASFNDNVLKTVNPKVVFLVQFCSPLWSMIHRALFRPPLHCTLIISVFGKVGPTSNNSNTFVRNLSPRSFIVQSISI